jgi:hypothetical protein
VLPSVALPCSPTIDGSVGVSVDVTVEVILVVNIDIATIPIAVAPVVGPRASQDKPSSKCKTHPGVVSRITVRIIGIGRRSSSVDHLRVIRGNVNYVGVRLLNCDHLIAAWNCLGLYDLLRIGL